MVMDKYLIYLLSCALKRKYKEDIELKPLCDALENEAHEYAKVLEK